MSVHWTLAVIAWFLGVGLATGALPASVPNASTTAYWATAGVGVVAFFLSILLHELAHALVARRYGVQTDGIELWLLGGMARLNRDAPSPKADGLIAVSWAAGQHPRRRGLHRRAIGPRLRPAVWPPGAGHDRLARHRQHHHRRLQPPARRAAGRRAHPPGHPLGAAPRPCSGDPRGRARPASSSAGPSSSSACG